ncbi:P27 family phage terminase small subunit [Halothermothrix orenii]|uniref:RNA polymerase subunit sigma-70 n=1 Tax=Halothermothrix orenii (strain H 168 / OCM 544 / DSM 9562) TaxID=373903 RepID=B8D1N6_HALOH|nr:P27 family phage terminase small subunit [Halothermothrix orenii]ACL69113.1 hypothetical protein Hore_03520 [Halothermothrix orenii H 168]
MTANKREQIKRDLLDQLDEETAQKRHFRDLVDDYLQLWDIKNMLIKDIKERGVVVEYNHGGGQSGFKKNDSINELKKVHYQMIKILKTLSIESSPKEKEVEIPEM